jgi:hypothetical protein
LLVRSRRWVIQKLSVGWFAGCIDALLEMRVGESERQKILR